MKRLGARNIGPRILGIFTNGRFEQFLKAKTLTKEDIRYPDVSRGIAKRMRELHDGVDLTVAERLAGPGIWSNMRRWSADAKKALDRLDRIAELNSSSDSSAPGAPWTTRKILGSDWATFIESVRRYKEWVEKIAGGEEAIKKGMVFAHNDV